LFGHITYIAIAALAVNLVVAFVLTPIFRAIRLPNGYDETRGAHYYADSVDGPAATAGTRGA